MNDGQLLQTFAEEHSESAFRSLAERRLPLVFVTARALTAEQRRRRPEQEAIPVQPAAAPETADTSDFKTVRKNYLDGTALMVR